MADPIYLTQKGLDKIKEELKHLKTVKREEISANMGKAIEDGDLRESAAYDEARLAQSENETRIADLEELVYRAVIVEAEEGADAKAALGASLLLEDPKGKQETYHLVGTYEADIFENRISDESPFGQQMVGKKAGDTVVMKGARGKTEFKVIEVTFE